MVQKDWSKETRWWRVERGRFARVLKAEQLAAEVTRNERGTWDWEVWTKDAASALFATPTAQGSAVRLRGAMRLATMEAKRLLASAGRSP